MRSITRKSCWANAKRFLSTQLVDKSAKTHILENRRQHIFDMQTREVQIFWTKSQTFFLFFVTLAFIIFSVVLEKVFSTK